MAVIYSQIAINDRLLGVVTAIGGGGLGGQLILLAGSTPISTITLQIPCGTVSGGVLTFTGSLIDPSAAGVGNCTGGKIQDSNGNLIVSGLTAGIPGATADIIITNGLNSTFINAGQVVQLLAASITGS